MKLPIVALFTCFVSLQASELGGPIVKLRNGSPVMGSEVTMPDGNTLWQFLAIPYAQAPQGALRFKAPLAAKPWTHTRNATSHGPICVQSIKGTHMDKWGGAWSENCLTLNVWVPKNVSQNDTKLAVMVSIHGGGFYAGSSSEPHLDGKILANFGQVVVVSMNYRLGIFGFLYSGSPEAPGNMGLLDQQLALKWVHRNIEKFGGDPKKVTIFGESAGGVSVSFHLLSPKSWPFFHRAIVQSGVITNPWAMNSNQEMKNRTIALGHKVGCSQDDLPSLIGCIASKKVRDLLGAFHHLKEQFLSITWSPVVDGKFLTADPNTLLESGRFKKVALVVGNVLNEASIFFPIYNPFKLFPTFTASPNLTADAFRSTLSKIMPQTYDADNSKNILDESVFYEYQPYGVSSNDPAIFEKRLDALESMGTDAFFTCDSLKLAEIFQKSDQKVFNYVFTRPNPQFPPWMGANHALELKFMYGDPLRDHSATNSTYNLEEVRLSEKMMKFWTNFAKFGDPNNPKETSVEEWPQYGNDGTYLAIDGHNDQTGAKFRQKRCYFWNNYVKALYNATQGMC